MTAKNILSGRAEALADDTVYDTATLDTATFDDAGFVLETPDGAPFDGDPFAAIPESYPRAPLPLLEVR